MVFSVLLQHQLFVKRSKCEFGATQIDYLGHVINQGGVAMDNKKVDCMLQWPAPKTVKELRRFLGLTGYYRRFIRAYSTLAKPLTELLKKGEFKWTEQAQLAFDSLKKAMTTAPILALPNFESTFVVKFDASRIP